MPLSGSTRVFGLRDIKLTPIPAGTQIDLPAAMTLSFSERLTSGEMRGDDSTIAIVATTDAIEWELEAGGISMEAWALMSGRTLTTSGTTPNQTNTMLGRAGDVYPYFKIYGQSIGDTGGDVHVLIYKAKLTGAIEGEWKDEEFFVTKCSGIAIDDGSKLYEIVQHETKAAVPAT